MHPEYSALGTTRTMQLHTGQSNSISNRALPTPVDSRVSFPANRSTLPHALHRVSYISSPGIVPRLSMSMQRQLCRGSTYTRIWAGHTGQAMPNSAGSN